MRGLAIERAPGSDRWLVQLEDGSLKSVREAHLVRQSVHSDGSVRDGADGDGGIEAAMVAAQARALGTARGLGSRALSRALSRIAPEHLAARLLGLAYHAAGQQALAVRNLRECVRVAEETYGPEQPAVAVALASLGMVLLDSEAQDNAPVSEAIRCLERSLALEEASEASSNASTSAVSSASVDDAIDEAARQQMPTRVPHHVSTRLALAKAYRLRGDPAAGRDLLDRCLKVLGEDVDATASTCTYRPPSTASTSAPSSSTTCAVSPHSSSPAPPEPNTTPNTTLNPEPKPRDASSLPRPVADMLTVVLEEYAHAELALAAEAASAARDQADTALEELLAQMAHGESDGADHLLIPELEMERAQREGARHAAAHLSRCLEHRERVCGLRHEMLIPLLRRLGAQWQHARELPRAAAALERAVDISLHVQGAAGGASADGDSVLACLLSQLRDVYVGQGETAKAGDTQQRIARLCAGSASQPRSQSHR
jgi:tetratricopeptide (TPR) repeat protein